MKIRVKYFDDNMKRLVKEEKGDWIDLSVINACTCDNDEEVIKSIIKNRTKETWSQDGKIWFVEGDVIVMRLGVAIQLPADKKAQVISRSSTFANYGLILTNCVGAIDNKYQGNEDEWLAVYYATRTGFINRYDRICQFDIVDRMDVEIEEAVTLDGDCRGGYGTSGKQ